ncbi:sulfotransferase [Xanthomonadaceae bacterium JHOS43]|nr:sulfotransferase [Xanthomonadaceae bacterium JHOS43]
MNPNTSDPQHLYAQAVSALNQSRWIDAARLADRLMETAPPHAGVQFIAGVAALQMHRVAQAVAHLDVATAMNPTRADYAIQYARALATGRMLREAVQVADKALALGPSDALSLDTLGVIYTQANAHDQAVTLFQRAVDKEPTRASYRFNLATALTFQGELDASEREYEACLAIDPAYWKVHLALSQLRRQTPESNHLERLRSLLAQHTDSPPAQLYLNLALAKELEDLREFPQSFAHLTAGKSSQRNLRNYSSRRDEALFNALMQEFSAPRDDPDRDGHDSAEPIFIVGMPRSGTTLVDRILSNHSQVHSAGELQTFAVQLKRLSGSRTPPLLDPDTVARSRRIDWKQLGASYIDNTRPGTGHTPRFVDKLPHNFLYLGHIARALPNAKIVCLRRDPLDTCLSNFRQLFALTTPFYDYSFDILDIGRYYVLFDRLMAHWQRVLPGRILEVRYETLVDAQEECTRQLLDFCGLPWEDACLRFEENDAPVATASAVQVRAPLFRSSLNRWKNYASELEPLKALLASEGIPLAETDR